MQHWFRWVLFAGIGTLSLMAVRQGWLSFLTDEHQVATYLNTHGLMGLLIVTASGTFYTAVGGPRQLLAFVLGFATDSVYGTLLSTLITLFGAAACFYSARLLLRHSLSERFGHRMARFNQMFHHHTATKVLMVRLLPVGSNLITNLLAGCSSIRFPAFALGSGLGYLPQMLIFALAGAGIGHANQYQFLVSVALFIIASLLGGYLYHQQRTQALSSALSEDS